MKNLTCCFTGHRDIKSEDVPEIKKNIWAEIEKLIKRGILYYGCGGAIGFDTLAAETVLEMKEKYNNIRLILVLPCEDQSDGWNSENRMKYENIMKKADKVIYTSDKYYRGCMQKRNRHLVDHSCVCIAYVRKSRGGSAYTLKYANENGLEIIFV